MLFLFLSWMLIRLGTLCKMELPNLSVKSYDNTWFSLPCPEGGVSKWPFTPSTLPLTFMNCSGWTNSDVDIDMSETSSFPKDSFDKKLLSNLSAGPQDFNMNAPWIQDASIKVCQLWGIQYHSTDACEYNYGCLKDSFLSDSFLLINREKQVA